MNTINNFIKIYKLGLRWSIFEPVDELFAQLAYVALVITEIAIIWNIKHVYTIIYTCMMVMHLLSMYILGYLKQLWEGSILEGSHKEEIYHKTYIALNVCFLAVTILITKSKFPLLLILIPTIGSILIMYLWVLLVFITQNLLDILNPFDDNSQINLFILYTLIIGPVAISVLDLPIFIAWRLVILATFIVLIPLIVVGADNGMDFLEILSVV